MADKITIVISISIGFVVGKQEIDFEVDATDWSEMDDEEKDAMCLEEMLQHIEWGYAEKEAARG